MIAHTPFANRMAIYAALLVCTMFYVGADAAINSVKGRSDGGQFPYYAADNYKRFFNNETSNLVHHNSTQGSHGVDYERGVCYIEVPTINIAKDANHVPAGNGSTPYLSRIRSCCRGWVRNIHNFRLCDPVCSGGCLNGLCVGPEMCSCYPDYVRNRGGFCVPTCPINCQNGHCVGNECVCDNGFRLSEEGKYCVPICRKDCSSQGVGNCTAPNVCACSPGFSFVDGICQASCEGGCLNGECVRQNQCVCDPGFTMLNQRCVPRCTRGCVGGQCVAPDVCQCPAGMQLNNNSSCTRSPTPAACPTGWTSNKAGQCVPPCYKQCPNGECSGPNTCSCHHGYIKNSNDECVPHCPRDCGQFGVCVSPDICECLPGSLMDPVTHVCSQGTAGDCSLRCTNGVCSGNECTCNYGYTHDQSGMRCIPNCPGGCPNGTCSSPNFCICNAGFFKDRSVKGRQSCVRRNRRSINDDALESIRRKLIFKVPDYIVQML